MKRHLQCAKQQVPPSNLTKYRACHAKWISSLIHMKRHFQRAEQVKSPFKLTKNCACHEIFKLKASAETPWSASANRKTIRGQSEDNPTIKSSSRTRRFGDLPGPILEMILYWKIQHFPLQLSPKISRNAAPATKSHTPAWPKRLRLPRKMNLMIDPRYFWNVISNAPSKYSHPSNSPSTAPATKFWGQDFWGTSLNCIRQ